MVVGPNLISAVVFGCAALVVKYGSRAVHLHAVLEAVPVWCLTRSLN